MNETVAKIRTSFDRRRALLGLHVVCFAAPLIYFADGYLSNPLPDALQTNSSANGALLYHQALSLYGGLVTSIISALMGVIGFFSLSLHEDSSMVVHKSAALWLMHLLLFCGYQQDSRYYTLSRVFNLSHLTTAGDVSFNAIMLLLFTLQVVLASAILRRNNSDWPRSNLMQLFTLESPLLLARLVLSCFCYGMAENWSRNSVGSYQNENPNSTLISIVYFSVASSLLNFIICLENIITLFWGVPHRLMMGIEAIVSSVLLFVSLIIHSASTDILSDYDLWIEFFLPWYSASCVLGLVHGILNLVFPSFISKVPAVFQGHGIDSNNQPVEASPSDGGLPYSRMLSGIFGSSGPDSSEHSPSRTRKSILCLIKESPSLLRNVIYCMVCTVIFAMLGAGLPTLHPYHPRWQPIVLLCSATAVILRTFPDLLTELLVRTPLPAAPLAQVFTSIIMESVLLVIGMLGSWIPGLNGPLDHSAAGVCAVILLLHGLHIRSYLK